VETDNSDSGKELGFSIRLFALCIIFLIASRFAIWGVGEFISDGNWLAGILGVILASVIAY
jgi:hypothetical protein